MSNDLIARLEAATGASRELDAAIAEAVGYIVRYDKADPRGTTPYYQPVPDYSWRPVPTYTASIDAALTLVPEGWDYTIYSRGEVSVHRSKSGTRTFYDAEAATPALAICIAALKARGVQ